MISRIFRNIVHVIKGSSAIEDFECAIDNYTDAVQDFDHYDVQTMKKFETARRNLRKYTTYLISFHHTDDLSRRVLLDEIDGFASDQEFSIAIELANIPFDIGGACEASFRNEMSILALDRFKPYKSQLHPNLVRAMGLHIDHDKEQKSWLPYSGLIDSHP